MTDAASTTDLDEAIERLLPGLMEFSQFEGTDRAAPRSDWLPLIDEALPQEGAASSPWLKTKTPNRRGNLPGGARPTGESISALRREASRCGRSSKKSARTESKNGSCGTTIVLA